MNKSRSPNIQVNNIKLKQVPEFTYLGSILMEDGRIKREIETRCHTVNTVTYQISPLLRHSKIDMTTKNRNINSILLHIPLLSMSKKKRSLSKAQKRTIIPCEIRCLIKVINVTRRQRMRNDDIRKNVGTTRCIKHMEMQKIKGFVNS